MTSARLATIKELLDAFARSGAEELQVTDGDLKLRIVRRKGATAASPAASAGIAPAAVPESDAAMAGGGEASAEPEADAPADGVLVTAAMHGVFHRAPAPGADPFVGVGSHVVRGQQLCILEAMKVFNAVTAPQDGIVAEVHVENGTDVMAGQPLFTLAAPPQLKAAE
ncbi:MAG: biotin/lipoyl-binding protein [Proteobacteria bacterium]|nr:biotin/lipoyl-binding protein [Pseudomonadota bacterium]